MLIVSIGNYTTMANCLCPVQTLTSHQEHYPQFDKPQIMSITHGRPTSDQELISGHNENNLQINGLRVKSKVWPNMLPQSEEYQDFLDRLKRCKTDIFNLYFKNPSVDKSILEDMFKNLSKSSYQLLFSPDVFEPRKESRRFAKSHQKPVNMKYKETTYNTYFGRIQELERFRNALYGAILKDCRKELKIELRDIYRCGRTTYNDTISQPASIYAKETLRGPIDRYTCRRI